MTFGYIYKIQFPNGKHYIGLTTTALEQRQNEHKKTAKKGDIRCLYNALRKYEMVDTFQLIEIDTADTLEELCEKEMRYIIEYNSYYMNKNGYNMTYGGEGTTGYVYTEDVKQKMSKIAKKRFENPEAIQKNSEVMKKYYQEHPEALQINRETQIKYNEEHPEKGESHSKIMKAHYENPEAIQKNRETQIKYNQEHPEKGEAHSEKIKAHYDNHPEARQQMSEIKKQYHNDHPEAGKAHSEKIKAYYNNPEAKQKHSEAQKKRFDNPEERKKMSELKKAHYNNPERLDVMGENKQFDVLKDGAFIKTFTYQFQAKEYLQKEYEIKSDIKIKNVLTGTQKSSAGFVFKYK
jgi:hypothetical protein